MNTEAVKVLAKVAPLKFSIETALERKRVKLIPKTHRAKMKLFLTEIKALELSAQATVSQQKVLTVTLSDVMEKCTAAQNHVTMFVNIINTLASTV